MYDRKGDTKKKDNEYICGMGNERKYFFHGAKFLLGYFLCAIKWEMVEFCVFITLIKAYFTLTERPTSSYFLSLSSAINLASFSCEHNISIRSSRICELLSNSFRCLFLPNKCR